MDSSGFHLLVKNFTNLTEDECAEVGKLSKEYPYSQILYLLHSRAAQDLQSQEKTTLLHQSALYATDRSILKLVMTASRRERISPPTLAPPPFIVLSEPVANVPEPLMKVKDPELLPSVTLTGDALRDDLYHELEKLQRLKHDFGISIDQFNKSQREDVELIKKARDVKEPIADPLLEEIKSTKKKLKVEGTKQKEQNEIIDQFIKTKPVLLKPKPVVPSADLSEDSGIFSDNIVSETLVNILLKQGKKDKAIEVLKKLIWKFPQKKAYFAAQIENLKN